MTDRQFKPWESDHTALVHVLWGLRDEGVIGRDVDCDTLASRIMQSEWMQAVRQEAGEGS